MPALHDLLSHSDLLSAWWIAGAALLAPILASATRRKVPDVVWLLLLGVVIGPSVLHLAELSAGVSFVREIGLGLLFFIAGVEINMEDLADAAGKHARLTYLVCLILGIGVGFWLSAGNLQAAIALGIATTSTALGTLLPILKDAGRVGTPLGAMALRHGAVGELGPIIAMTLLLSARAPWKSAVVLLAFALLAGFVVYLPAHVFRTVPWVGRAMVSGVNTTAQTGLRFSMWVLMSLMALTSVLHLDVVLGAFAAGLLIGRLVGLHPEAKDIFESKLQVLGFSFLIPVFFVTSGMGIDARVVAHNWATVLLFAGLMLLVRGVPVYLLERLRRSSASDALNPQETVALALYAAVGLPIIVAVTEVATTTGLMTDEQGSILVAAGAVTVLVFPLLADQVLRRSPGATPKPAAAHHP
ncbi:potassium transporter Kef [Corynebacterium sp. 13CS0277]|uniref:cation:proton antiporter n=1 Tax=Corynebacterium sp. 13CS0277 TaxID=2071994 RepID=UPI000D04386E|nr:cation:proton antiporter [Corynebacterium sp. 13CS0277]PRQ11612.1 potassium transporter Kef [Corynebacterium sp. 13CS0277]